LPVPIQSGCIINIALPFPEYDLTNNDISDVQGYGLFGALRSLSYQIDTVLNAIKITNACSQS